MTAEEARARIAIHAGSAAGFTDGYAYALRYGFRNLEDVQQKFDDIFMCLKVLKKSSSFLDKELIVDLGQILWQSILYVNKQLSNYRVIGVFAEVLSEILIDFWGDTQEPFVAFDNYKENYDDIILQGDTKITNNKSSATEAIKIRHELQPLRLQAEWRIECNNFTEYDMPVHGKQNCYELHEDLLQLLNERANLIIDLGWYPSYDENGNYILLLIKNYDWDSPLEKVVSKSKNEIAAYIEKWVDWGFWGKYDE